MSSRVPCCQDVIIRYGPDDNKHARGLRYPRAAVQGSLWSPRFGNRESAVLGCLEPKPISSCYDDELPRVAQGHPPARDGKLARFRDQVNRSAFLVACRDYADEKPEEHLLIGYRFRHGSTTKVESLHHVIGGASSVRLPDVVAHAMWDYYGQHDCNELLIFHNQPRTIH